MHQRDKSHEWKCQPDKFLAPDVARHELLLGTFTLVILSAFSGIIAWYAANDGKYLTVYYKPDEYGWLWFFLQIPVTFILQASSIRMFLFG